ncbi:hypothetical protein HDV03_001605 [Kappamyces sp. JEL0829]|nr:hypothetical protein HDV03_001605 [Kappamyces sp. JEL0829]
MSLDVFNTSFFDTSSKSAATPSKVASTNQHWNDLDLFAAGAQSSNAASTKSSGDMFGLDLLGGLPAATPAVVAEDDLLGVLSLPVSKGQPKASQNASMSEPLVAVVPLAKPASVSETSKLQEGLAQLAAMGFEEETARAALVANQYKMQEAINSLLSGASRKNGQQSAESPEKLGPDDRYMQAAVAELVHMGFDPREAKAALAESNMDQQAAINLLVHSSRPDGSEVDQDVQHLMNMGFKASSCRAALKQSNGNVEKAVEQLLRNKQERRVSFSGDSSPQMSKDSLGLGSSRLAGVATQLGISVFKNAKNVYNSTKKKVGEVISELAKDSPAPTVGETEWERSQFRDAAGPAYAVPRAGSPQADGVSSKPFSPSRLLDGDTDGSVDSLDIPLQRNVPRETSPPQLLSLEDDSEAAAGPSRRPATTPQKPELLDLSQASSGSKPHPVPPSKQKPPEVPASELQLSRSNELRLLGNEFFKQGQFGDAEAQYSLAIDSLPSGHSQLIPLYNNRAACKLKNGDNRGAVSDCSVILDQDPNDIKALLRRAAGYEALENWNLAREDYRRILGIDASAKGCSLGLSRCNLALQPKQAASKPVAQATTGGALLQTAEPKAVATSVKRAVEDAVQKLRDLQDANEQLENDKFNASEAVNLKIDAWKNNKESNIRALLSSLDTILWPDCGWKPVQLGELITPAQVKGKYMRAVAKLHPDKLSTDATIEQQLVASSAFTILNKAWDSFKLSNNM